MEKVSASNSLKDGIAAKSLQSCLTLCDPIDGNPTGSSVPGILQARTLEWAAISFSNAWKWKVKVKSLSHVRPLATPQTAAYQAPPSMGFPRQEYSSGLPFPSPGDLPDLASNPHLSLTYPALAGSFPPVLPGKQDPVSPYNKSFYLWVGPFKASSFEYSLVLGFLLNKNFE